MVPTKDLRVKYVPIGDVRPYEDNPRRNDGAVQAVVNSLREFGWKQPIVVDADGTIVVGHTRHKAALALEMTHVPVVVASDLTPEQCAAYRLADNRVGELAEWDGELLAQELDGLADLDMSAFGFTERDMERAAGGGVDFSNLDAMSGEGDEGYDEFVEKFKPKKTTDDCYTPPEVYEVIRDWACAEYGIDPEKVVRPFYPGGDYERFDYSGGKVVVDNPPFSILSKIVRFYLDNGVPFFLFCPSLTALGSASTCMDCCHVLTYCDIEYENGAVVHTSFVTSYDEGIVARTAPDLTRQVNDKVAELRHEKARNLPKYEYPREVLTAAMLSNMAKAGVELKVPASQCVRIGRLDAQEESGSSIYGGGLLVSERIAAERKEAERIAAERKEAERIAAERNSEQGGALAAPLIWELSDREREIVRSLGERHE